MEVIAVVMIKNGKTLYMVVNNGMWDNMLTMILV